MQVSPSMKLDGCQFFQQAYKSIFLKDGMNQNLNKTHNLTQIMLKNEK